MFVLIENGFSSQSPELNLSKIVKCGVTTAVGCLGVVTTMKTMAGPEPMTDSWSAAKAL